MLAAETRSMDPDQTRASCCFDDWASANAKRALRRETVAGVTHRLVPALEPFVEGRTVLDVGCGVGDLLLTLLARGASRGSGIDMGTGGIADAQRLAATRGLGDRASFTVGDAADTPLAPADIVVLNRVLCCYPQVGDLVARTSEAAGSVYAYTAPEDRGVAAVFNRASVACSNAWYRVRDRKYGGFRVFVHDLDAVDERIRAAGFERIRSERIRGAWRLALFLRR
jgi:SAM-dependent methyltransferase